MSVIDERAAGFMALGMAKATGRPVAVTCTSGTAAANLMPAVVEAWEARVPLIVLTADRPPELRDVGAGQAIDQMKLYGSAVKWFVEVGNSEPTRDWAMHLRALACRAFTTAVAARPGPVHLNLPLREPLAPDPDGLDLAVWEGRPGGRPWTDSRGHSEAPHAADVQAVAERMAAARRGVIVAGWSGEPVAEAVARLAAACGWPILAEPTSGVRCGPHERSHVVAHYDVLLRGEEFARAHAPELVVRIGDAPTSKPLRAWLATAPQVVLDPHGAWHEPTRSAELLIGGAAAQTADALAAAVEMRAPAADDAWLASWHAADARVGPALAASELEEAKSYAGLEPALPDGALVWVASSMPIRHVESFFPASERDIRFLSNRGANGIDGTVASAAGAALATGAPTFVLIGDIALAHDAGGLMAAARAQAGLGVLCNNNVGRRHLRLPARRRPRRRTCVRRTRGDRGRRRRGRAGRLGRARARAHRRCGRGDRRRCAGAPRRADDGAGAGGRRAARRHASSGSSASSLTSDSASSSAGTESATIPQPA